MTIAENLISLLQKISTIDGALARIKAERKKITDVITAGQSSIKKASLDLETKRRATADQRGRYDGEDKSLKDETNKLVSRRKALSTLGSYKLQQAGIREIEHVSRQLSSREESLVLVLEEVEKMDKEVAAFEKALIKQGEELNKGQADAQATLDSFIEREKTYQEARNELVKLVDPKDLAVYERIKGKYPCDPVATVENRSCSGCFIEVVPQLLVQIAGGSAIVKCRGCGRILYVPPTPDEGQKK